MPNNCRTGTCTFSINFGAGKLGRISTENSFETSYREGSRGTTLRLTCASVGVVINKSSRLLDRVWNFCLLKVRNLFQFFNSTKTSKEESVPSPDRIKRQLPSSVSPSQRSPANRQVLRTGLRATAAVSKSSSRKSLVLSSVQQQSRQQPKDNFLS